MSDSDGDQQAAPSVESPSLAASRSRRDNAGKRKAPAGKFAALQRLREAREQGKKMNYEVEEVQNVYDIVDESEYAEEVSKKRDEEWIVDDDGGYVEDGREIFDEEEDDIGYDSKTNTKSKEKGEKVKKEGVRSSNIKNMLLNMPSKKQVEEAKLEEDALLGDILGQIKSKAKAGTGIKKVARAPTASSTVERNPFVKKGTGLRKVVTAPKPSASSNVGGEVVGDEEMVTETQKVEEFDTEAMEGFDDEMDIQDFDEEMEEQTVEPEESATKEDEANKARGFVSLAEGSGVGDGQWFSSGPKEQVAVQEVAVDTSHLPTIKLEGGEDVLRMYFLDAHEDPYKHPGTVWLFGKVCVGEAKSWVSCCVTVKNIPRRVFLAKRENWTNTKTGEVMEDKPVSTMDLYNEFNDKIAKRYKINEHKCRPVEKLYAFEHTDIPDSGHYLEVVYSSQYPALPPDLKGETFCRVFGAPQTSLEWFLLEQKIKGPGWLDIKTAIPSSPPVSWCKLEASVTDPASVTVSPCNDETPPLTILSIKLGTVINFKTQQNEVSMVGCLAHTNFSLSSPTSEMYNQHYCLLTKPVDEAWPYDWTKVGPTASSITKVEKANSERELLSLFLLKVQKLDPDVIIGHDVASFDLEVLIHRMVQNKIAHWSRLGRLRRSNQPGNKFLEKQAMVGRCVADLKISAKELIRCKSYELGALVEKCLREGTDETRPKLTPDTLRKAFSSSADLKAAIMMCMRDADQTLRLMVQLQALPLALQISQIVGTVLSRTLRGGRAERIESLLLHAFTQLGYIVPDKQFGKKKVENEDEDTEAAPKGRKKPSYAGGLVLDPKKGFYDKYILLLDFNSLYPSIIQEYNICFTTVDRTKKEKTAEGEMILPSLPDTSLPAGVLPTQIKKLVDSRREVKNILKRDKLTEAQKVQLNIRQLGLKLTANSMYGCLGFSYSRFFAKPLAAMVTSKGREILLQTRDLIQKMNLDVIYGDTDSVMVNTNSTDYDEVFKLGHEVKQAVNKLYRLLELDIDGVYKYMLLLKKKKYAAVTVEKDKDGIMRETTELKGLDIVRRDWSQLAADAGKTVISIIMTDKAEDARLSEIQDHLEGLKTALLDGKVALKDLGITKSLTKDPADYPDKKSLPHVQVAMRINSSGGKKLRAGDTVQYVICDDGSGLAATQRAYHVDEVKTSQTLKIDTQYYLAQQLHPVVSRLCDPIEGMDGARVAQCLGLDPSQYKQRVERSEEQGEGVVREEDRFRGCERLVVECACGDMLTIDSPVRGSGKDAFPALLCCPRTKECGGCPIQLEGKLVNAVDMLVRQMVNKYYAGWLMCEDPGCVGRTRVMPLQFQRAYPVCGTCTKATMYREYTDSQLYTQLQFITYLLDTKRMMEQADDQQTLSVRLHKDNNLQMYAGLKLRVENKFLKHNGYATVSLSKIFEGLFPVQSSTPAQA
eukprot:TRINITY_DN25936_c0_g1_i4.p1 TRINITY_DN25936_c0_g1~~TRINITY_DN25936_c0_g1_i4.p1  ORF type:complete len:1464 (-),score=583.40 TRINITY_DN25936_c0_g1_i4:126-4448(-)